MWGFYRCLKPPELLTDSSWPLDNITNVSIMIYFISGQLHLYFPSRQPSAFVVRLTAVHDHSNLLHRPNLHFLYICFPMRLRRSDHTSDQLQSAEPWSRRIKATAPAAAQQRCSVLIQNVLMSILLWAQMALRLTLHFLESPATNLCEADQTNHSQDVWVTDRQSSLSVHCS